MQVARNRTAGAHPFGFVASSMEAQTHMCNTPGVTMARAHLGTKDYDHMCKNLRSRGIRALETRF
jgi:hypothetical protein